MNDRRLPSGVVALGLVSLFMDVSSEMIHCLLPVFMTVTLGASIVTVGVIEGVAEATAADRQGVLRRVSRLVRATQAAGPAWAMGSPRLPKPLFPLAGGIGTIVMARFIDRIGKGIRGAPRDALIADVTPPEQRGAAFGLRQSLDSVGAFVGPLLALALIAAFAGDCASRVLGRRDPRIHRRRMHRRFRARAGGASGVAARRIPAPPAELARLPRRFWLVLAFASVLTLARFSEAFLVLRAQDVGLTLVWIPSS